MKKFTHVQVKFHVTPNLNRKEYEELKQFIHEEVNVMLSKIERKAKASPVNAEVSILSEDDNGRLW